MADGEIVRFAGLVKPDGEAEALCQRKFVMLGIAFMLGWSLTLFLAEREGTDRQTVKALTGFFTSLDKSIRGLRLYQGKGDIVTNLMTELEERKEAVVEGGAITLRLLPFGVMYEKDLVTPEGARLPYLFATCRFAHYLKCIVRDKVGSFKEKDDMQAWLNQWIQNYVENNPAMATEEDKARRPLAAAEVEVTEDPGNPGYYSSKFFLRPHYQLEGLTVSLRLVSKLPSAKG